MPDVRVLDVRTPGRHFVGSDDIPDRAAALAAELRALSGQDWRIGQYSATTDEPRRDAQGNLDVAGMVQDAGAADQPHVWIFGDSRLPDSREQYFRPLADGRTQVVHVFNTERPEEQLHTIGHTVELMARRYDPNGFQQYTGRPGDPWQVNLGDIDRPVAAVPYGHGTIHVPPNATRQYEYGGAGPWGGTEDGFYKWWLNEAPREWWQTLAEGRPVASLSQLAAPPSSGQASAVATPMAGVGTAKMPDPIRQALEPWLPLIIQKARQNGIPPAVLAGVIAYESGGNPNAVNKDSGATGLGQVMPFPGRPSQQELLKPEVNLDQSARILSSGIQRYGSIEKGLASYLGAIDNRGNITGAVDANGTGGHAYIRNVMGYAQRLGDWVAQHTVGGTAEAAGDTTMPSDTEYEAQGNQPPGVAAGMVPAKQTRGDKLYGDYAKLYKVYTAALETALESGATAQDRTAMSAAKTAMSAAEKDYEEYTKAGGVPSAADPDAATRPKPAAGRTPQAAVAPSTSPVLLKPDGTPQLGPDGQPIPNPAYRESSVTERAAAGAYGAQAEEARARAAAQKTPEEVAAESGSEVGLRGAQTRASTLQGDELELKLAAARKAQELADQLQQQVQEVLKMPDGPEKTQALTGLAQQATAYKDPGALLTYAHEQATLEFQKSQEDRRRQEAERTLQETQRQNQAKNVQSLVGLETQRSQAATAAQSQYDQYGVGSPERYAQVQSLHQPLDAGKAAAAVGLTPDDPQFQKVWGLFQQTQSSQPAPTVAPAPNAMAQMRTAVPPPPPAPQSGWAGAVLGQPASPAGAMDQNPVDAAAAQPGDNDPLARLGQLALAA